MNEQYIEEGLTFDDLLLVPSFSQVMPSTSSIDAPYPRNKAQYPPDKRSHGYGDRSEDGHMHGPGRGVRHNPQEHGHREQVQEVEQVKKSESGMIVDP